VKGQTVYENNVFIYELLENRGGKQYFLFIRAQEAHIKSGKIFRKLCTTTSGEHYIVKVFDVGVKPGVKISKDFWGEKVTKQSVSSMSHELVLVPKDMIQKAIGMALKFGFERGKKKESDLNEVNDAQIDTLFSYMTSQNSRIILMGTNITSPESIPSDRLRRECIIIHNAAKWTCT